MDLRIACLIASDPLIVLIYLTLFEEYTYLDSIVYRLRNSLADALNAFEDRYKDARLCAWASALNNTKQKEKNERLGAN